jgi:hypothetical protein
MAQSPDFVFLLLQYRFENMSNNKRKGDYLDTSDEIKQKASKSCGMISDLLIQPFVFFFACI